jgi:hypothetical protein
MDIDWAAQLYDQLEWHWQHQFRPRLDGLTDAEYFWEPVPDCWSIRPYGQNKAPEVVGAGEFRSEYEWPEPTPVPVTTIAWRLGHVITGCLLERSAAHFGGEPFRRKNFEYSGTAAGALDQLDAAYARWSAGVRSLDPAGLSRPCGPAEGVYAENPLASLVLHINRELLHHGAEIALLRDLYLRLGR